MRSIRQRLTEPERADLRELRAGLARIRRSLPPDALELLARQDAMPPSPEIERWVELDQAARLRRTG